MLFDPKWNKPSVAGFRAWLEQQDPDETFAYVSCDHCAVGQYLIAVGTGWRIAETRMVNKLNQFAMRACHAEDTYAPTFGAVLREMDGA